MLIVTGIGPTVVPYFLDGRDPGRWSDAAGRLLGLEGRPRGSDLRMVLDGRDPSTGQPLGNRRPRRRRGGWDLVFSAPKSLSLLASRLEVEPATALRSAHQAAAGDVVRYLESRLTLVRRSGSGTILPAEGLIAASFEHSRNAASEPHLHTHVLIANLSRAEGHWGSICNADWFLDRVALGGLYHLGLRHHLVREGWLLDWRLRPDGLADLADVPTASVRSASRQSRQVTVSGRFAARSPRRTPGAPTADDRWAVSLAWRDSAATGAGPADDGPGSEVERRVEVRLSTRRSDFRFADVVTALASSHPGGLTAADAVAWAQRFCAGRQPVASPTSGPRWATGAARRADEQLLGILKARQPPTDTGPERTRTPDEMVSELVKGRSRVCVLGAPPGENALLAHAELLAACREGWTRSGRTVAVLTPTAEGALRWGVLTGIGAFERGDRPDVLVVDRVDRRPTPELLRIVRDASSPQLVLVEGGTMPRLTNPASHGLVRAEALLGRYLEPPVEPWRVDPGADLCDRRVTGGERYGRPAAEDLLQRWHRAGRQSLLVGLGPEEVWALNRAALGETRPVRGAERFRAGDRVVVLKGTPGLPTAGTLGTVVEVEKRRRRGAAEVSLSWSDGRSTVASDGRTLARLGFGYAVTPRLAARSQLPLAVLGPAAALDRDRARARVVDDVSMAPDKGVEARLRRPTPGRGLGL